VLGEAVLLLLAEDQRAVGEHVELALRPLEDLGLVGRRLIELGRETRGPAVIAVSDRAVVDLDARHQIVLNCSNGCRQLVQYRSDLHGVGPKMFSSFVSTEPQ
jgi:hypothetical protein